MLLISYTEYFYEIFLYLLEEPLISQVRCFYWNLQDPIDKINDVQVHQTSFVNRWGYSKIVMNNIF